MTLHEGVLKQIDTYDELLELDGSPVQIVFNPNTSGESLAMWALVSVDNENDEVFLLNSIGGCSSYQEVYADIKVIYRLTPEENRS